MTDGDALKEHTKQIEELFGLYRDLGDRPMAAPTGDGNNEQASGEFDMSRMRDFASKLPPDNTIKRIEALEKMMA